MQSEVHRTVLALTLASVCAIANAGSPAVTVHRTVGFADLNLTRAADVAVLYQRLRVAAREVCQPLGERDLTLLAASQSCAEDAVDQAVGDVNSATLSRYHQMKKTEAPVVIARR
jgi:UrcA family protein